MRGHYSACGQIGTGPVRAALAGPAWALHSIVGWVALTNLCFSSMASLTLCSYTQILQSFVNFIWITQRHYHKNIKNNTLEIARLVFVTVNGAEVADCRKVKCRLTRFRLGRNENSIITKEYFNEK